MFVKRFFRKRVLPLILFALLGLVTPVGVQALSAAARSDTVGEFGKLNPPAPFPAREGGAGKSPLPAFPGRAWEGGGIDVAAVERASNAGEAAANSPQLEQQGRALFEAGQFSEAAKIWQQAADTFAASGDKLRQAIALSNLSLTYQQLGQWNQAKEAISKSLELLQNSELGSGNSALVLAQTLNIQGRLQLSLGQATDALTTLKQANAIYKKAGDQAGITSNLINQAQAMQALGSYRQAANLLEELEKNLQNEPDSLIKATGLLSLGNTLRVVGDLDKSQQALQQSLQVAEKLQAANAIASAQVSLGNTKRALARKAEDLDEKETVQSETQAALNFYRQAATTSTSRNTRIQALVNQLSLLIETQQKSAAQALLPTIQQELDNLTPSRTSVFARINLAESLTKQGSGGEFLTENNTAQLLAKAVQDAKNLGDQRAQSYALGSLGELYEQNQQWSNAQELTQQALILAQAINALDISYRWQWQLGRLLKAQGQNEAAIAAYTEAVSTLQSLRSDLAAINPEVQFSFRESVEPVYRQFVELLLQTGDGQKENPTVQSSAIQKNLVKARTVIESLQLAELDNFFQEACLNAKPELIDQVDKTAAVIYPIILPDQLGVILSLPEQPLRSYSTKLPQSQVENILVQLQQDLGRPSSSRQEILRLSQQVYDWLIRPAEAEIKNSGVKTLVFVLDGALRNIPMAVLHDGKQYLMEQYNLALAPGLQLLEPQSLARVNLKALTVGLSQSREGFPALPGVERELKQINAVVPNSTVLLNQQFTGATLQSQINAAPFPVVHLATHGKFSSNADNTFILAWDGRINVKRLDEYLRARSQGKGEAIELLVLSACETAAGDKRATLGLAGMALRAGARSTLATLWPVKDVTTANLMAEFYRELGTNGKAESLRLAQASILQKFKHPYYWAPYVLIGNWL